MNRFTNALSALFKLTGWQPLLVLLLALTIRVVYNLFFFQHRICDIGDSSYYLTAGKALADLIRVSWSETHLSDFLVRLCQPTSVIPGSFQSFSSTNLSDRLLLDGPIFPSYLAGLFLLIGAQTGAAANLALNAHSQFYAIANSVVDSFSCALVCAFVSLAFGRKTGLLAGIGLALYAPSIINTQQCYGEPFAYFLLCCWALLLVCLSRCCSGADNNQTKFWLLNCFLLALFSGLLMLAKPAFVFLPWLGIGVYLVALATYKGRSILPVGANKPNLLLGLLTFALGLTVALAPWLGFTRSVSGQAMLVVNRAPQYNLYIGNYLATDGWKTWPTQANIPNTMAEAKAFVMEEFKSSPLALIGLFLRKIARLTVGVWNEFQYTIGMFTIVEQNIWQGVLLLLASLGLAAILGKKSEQPAVDSPNAFVEDNDWAKALALSFAAIILFHLIYACFEPVPRYAITAMPLVIAFAAQGFLTVYGAFTQSKSQLQRALNVLLVLLVLCGFSCLYRFVSFVPQLVWFFPDRSFDQIRIFAALLWCAYFVLIFGLLGQCLKVTGANSKTSLASLMLAGTLTISCIAAFYLHDPALRECSTWLIPGFDYDINLGLAIEVAQKVRYPATELQNEGVASPYSFVIVDCESSTLPPVLNVAVNGTSVPVQPALMWNELLPAEKDVPVILDLQSRAMSVDKRLFRQWWAIRIPTKCLIENYENEVVLSVPLDSKQVRIFADFEDAKNNAALLIPSLSKFSWTKGFLTFDHRDARPYEAEPCTTLISPEPKPFVSRKLEKRYRIRLACPRLKKQEDAVESAPKDSAANVVFWYLKKRFVIGSDPRTFKLLGHISDDGLTANMRFDFSFEVGMSKGARPVEVELAFSGTKAGQPITWRSQWQPASIKADSEWQRYTYSNLLPADFNQWKNITCTVSMSPFAADQLYLHPKDAQRTQMTVRDLRLEISPSGLPSGEFLWVLH